MKKYALLSIGFIIGMSFVVLTTGDNLKNLIKVSTMQVDTSYCHSVLSVEICNTDTVRKTYSDKLIIITGRNSIKEKFNVEKSEWIDSVLLTKPIRVTKDGSAVNIRYKEFLITYYTFDASEIFLTDNNGALIIIDSGFNIKKHTIAPETMQNLHTVIKRYL